MTKKLYHEDQYLKEFTSVVRGIENDSIILEETAFYPGGGGQPHDTGYIYGRGWKMDVKKVFEEGELIVHRGFIEGETPKAGEKVKGVINWERRYRLMRMHTAAHVLGYAVKRLYGLKAVPLF